MLYVCMIMSNNAFYLYSDNTVVPLLKDTLEKTRF